MSGPATPPPEGGPPAPGASGAGTRSPIIAPGPLPAVLTAALAALLAGAALLGQTAALPVVVVLQAVTAAGWFRLNGMWPARQGIALAFAGGLVADAALLAASREQAPEALLGALGVWFLMVVVLQLRHQGSAEERLDSLSATAAATLLTVLAAGLAAAVAESSAAVAVTAAGAGAAALAAAVVRGPALSAAAGLLAGGGVGLAAAGVTDLGAAAVVLGGVAGACAVVGLRVASYDRPSRFVHFTAGVSLPLTATAPAAYLLARTLV